MGISSRRAVAKITGKEGILFTGNAKVFNSEEEGMAAILEKKTQRVMWLLLDLRVRK